MTIIGCSAYMTPCACLSSSMRFAVSISRYCARVSLSYSALDQFISL